ncbi:probable glutamate receptor [Haliotis cracherodii]|uniref:probable glutamate receptor n=1 Tax=Haliotis cracherodii TaxID=6455 RepID=UPI0039E8F5AB
MAGGREADLLCNNASVLTLQVYLIVMCVCTCRCEDALSENTSPGCGYHGLLTADVKFITVVFDHESEQQASEASRYINSHGVQIILLDVASMYIHLADRVTQLLEGENLVAMRNSLTFLVLLHEYPMEKVIQEIQYVDEKFGMNTTLSRLSRWLFLLSQHLSIASNDSVNLNNIAVSVSLGLKCEEEVNILKSTPQGTFWEKAVMKPGDYIFNNIKYDLNGQTLSVLAMEWGPFTKEHISNGSIDITGICRDVLDVLAKHMHFSFRFVQPADRSLGALQPSGNWTGVVGMLQRREADLCISPYSPNEARMKVMSFGYLFNYEDAVVVYKNKMKSGSDWRILKNCFKTNVYLCGLIAAIVVYLIFVVSESAYIFYTESKSKPTIWATLNLMMLECIAVPLRQGIPRLPSSTSGRLVLAFWCVYTMIMTSIFIGSLVAILSTNNDEVPFKTLKELAANKDFGVDIEDGSVLKHIMKTSSNPDFQAIWKKISVSKAADANESSHQKWTRQRNKLYSGGFALISSRANVDFFMSEHCGLHIMNEGILPLFSSFVFPRHSPLALMMSHRFQALADAGLIPLWNKKWAPQKKSCVPDSKSKPIAVSDLMSAFIVCVAGLGMSLMCLILEKVFQKYGERYF